MRNILILLALVVAFIVTIKNAGTSPTPATAPVKPMAAKSPAEEAKTCEQELERRLTQYATFLKEKAYWAASAEIRNCATLLKRDDLLAKVKDAEVKSHMADINGPRVSLRDKAKAMEMLVRDYPDLGAKYESQIPVLLKRADAEEARALAAKRRSEGVRIGMTREEVLASSWGRPNDINRTTNAYGVREQWVYGGGYLYFDDGVLTSIQN